MVLALHRNLLLSQIPVSFWWRLYPLLLCQNQTWKIPIAYHSFKTLCLYSPRLPICTVCPRAAAAVIHQQTPSITVLQLTLHYLSDVPHILLGKETKIGTWEGNTASPSFSAPKICLLVAPNSSNVTQVYACVKIKTRILKDHSQSPTEKKELYLHCTCCSWK